ncbi:hypothetical protein KIPB_001665 [Kipferlia bialata]|uniref:Uncharacterized protein n=1 Tax=Kipferlia bialata TaxID=797122 RepID=A0A9K3CP68_9EUKA|nr:hypothetical protein KIPB_001665 [Kipferlia bialata]|eukprot:g1665.t1
MTVPFQFEGVGCRVTLPIGSDIPGLPMPGETERERVVEGTIRSFDPSGSLHLEHALFSLAGDKVASSYSTEGWSIPCSLLAGRHDLFHRVPTPLGYPDVHKTLSDNPASPVCLTNCRLRSLLTPTPPPPSSSDRDAVLTCLCHHMLWVSGVTVFGGYLRDWVVRGESASDIDVLVPSKDELESAKQSLVTFAESIGLKEVVSEKKPAAATTKRGDSYSTTKLRFSLPESSVSVAVDLAVPQEDVRCDCRAGNLSLSILSGLTVRVPCDPKSQCERCTVEDCVNDALQRRFVSVADWEVLSANRAMGVIARLVQRYLERGWALGSVLPLTQVEHLQSYFGYPHWEKAGLIYLLPKRPPITPLRPTGKKNKKQKKKGKTYFRPMGQFAFVPPAENRDPSSLHITYRGNYPVPVPMKKKGKTDFSRFSLLSPPPPIVDEHRLPTYGGNYPVSVPTKPSKLAHKLAKSITSGEHPAILAVETWDTKLDIGCPLADKPAMALARRLPSLTHLEELVIEFQRPCDSGAVAIARALGCVPSLKKVSFTGMVVGKAAARAFSVSLPALPALTEFYLLGCDISPRQIPALGTGLSLANTLQRFYLRESATSPLDPRSHDRIYTALRHANRAFRRQRKGMYVVQ